MFLIRQARTFSRLKVANSGEQCLRISGMHATRTVFCANTGAVEISRAGTAKISTVFDIFIFNLSGQLDGLYWH